MLSNIHRPSTILLVISGIFALISVLMMVLVYGSVKNVGRFEQELNQVGVIRGTAQRAVKLELIGANSEDIDKQIRVVTRNISAFVRSDLDPELGVKFNGLYRVWEDLLVDLRTYRARPTAARVDDILLNSEQMWQLSGTISELITSRNKVRGKTLNILFGLLLVNMLCIAGLAWFVWGIVRCKLENEVITDSLCGIGSRRSFELELESQWHLQERYGENFSVLLLDIDHFKGINDAFGHSIGDLVLKHMAGMLRVNTRTTDKIFRVGGEEFAIIAPHTSKIAAAQMADLLRQSISEYRFPEAGHISVSIGIAEANEAITAEGLYEAADKAMYFVKSHGRNGTHFAGEIIPRREGSAFDDSYASMHAKGSRDSGFAPSS